MTSSQFENTTNSSHHYSPAGSNNKKLNRTPPYQNGQQVYNTTGVLLLKTPPLRSRSGQIFKCLRALFIRSV